jgi:outer membrane protein OmpA-like peptidoglycan-associated protein
MIARLVGLCGAAVLLLTAPLAAQKAGTIELGAFGRYTNFDQVLGMNDGGGGGGRIGIFLARNLEIEGDVSYTSMERERNVGGHISAVPIHARLLYNIPAGDHAAVILGGGYVRNKYGKNLDDTDNGVAGLVGLRAALGGAISLRFDVTVDYMSTPVTEELIPVDHDNWNYGLQAGLSLLTGQGPRDSDRDGIANEFDRCPDTPRGAVVDSNGCPDSDGDGVFDLTDQCANTPAGDAVDASGCSLPKDADSDGVTDDLDRCPNTPAGDAVDANGCSLPKDADGDGVVDSADRCPNTPAGTQVDASGCPIPQDSDGDGVNDDRDRCPGTPAGVQVDAVGCRILFQEQQTTLVLEGVNFETGKADLTQAARAILLTVAQSLVANAEIRVEVGGHTDITGSRGLNMRLSQARAESVQTFLIQNGVSTDRLQARGYGPDNPIDSNNTRDGRARNRRVELTRLN